MQSYEVLLAGAVEGALQAGKVIRKHFDKKLTIKEKGDKGGSLGLVTNVDIEAEAAALKVLTSCEPSFGLLTEESRPEGRQEKGDQGLWILDPLDGTTNFVHRFPMFCVTVAGQIGRQVVVAATYHPILDELYTAIRGKGAFLNGKPMKVSTTNKVRDALLSTGFTYQRYHALNREMSSFEKISREARAVRRPGSAALDLAYTARGVFDGFWERHLSPWDMAAGALLVSEAGGRVSDFSGKKFYTNGFEILATNRKIHAPIMKLL